MTLLGSGLRQLRQALRAAPDGALARIVGLVDSLADRATAEPLIEEVRPRLRLIRPPRPLRLNRLLCLPLEGALVPAAAWRGAPGEIPRHALQPLLVLLRPHLGPTAEELEAAALGHSMADTALVGRLGVAAWPIAAAAAGRIDPADPAWRAAEVPAAAVPGLLRLAGALWGAGLPLWQAREAGAGGPPETLLRAALLPLAGVESAALAAGAALLMRHAAAPGRVAEVAAALLPDTAPRLEREWQALLADHAAGLRATDCPGIMAAMAGTLAAQVEEAETQDSLPGREARRRRLAALRTEAAGACHARFDDALRHGLIAPAEACAGVLDDAAVAALEARARDLARLDAAGRRLGRAEAFDRTLREVLPELAALAGRRGGLATVEVARLAEILAGPQRAEELLARS